MNKSLKNQEDACKLYASKKPDWNVVKVFTEKGESAKTTDTKAKRIARTINALSNKMNYAEMIRAGK